MRASKLTEKSMSKKISAQVGIIGAIELDKS